MNPTPRLCRAATLVVAVAFASAAARPDAIDDYLRREMGLRKIPGLAVAVARAGKVERVSRYGVANVETGTPVSESSIFAIASLDKQLTAGGVLRAAELGKLTLDDPVKKWIEIDLPGVTLRHLLSHTSGLPDQVAGTLDGREFTRYTTSQLLDSIRTLSPVAPPGQRYLYSDANLFLAQVATEKAVGEPWWNFMRRELFGPAGITSVVSMDPEVVIPGRVAAYTLDAAGALRRDGRLDVEYGPLFNDLGMTVADFARWLAALDGDRPLARASRDAAWTPMLLADGGPAGDIFQWSRYGLGIGIDDFLGEKVLLHSGHSGVGVAKFPARGLSVVVFTNLAHPSGSDPVGLALGVAGLLDPALSLATLPARPPGDPQLAAKLRSDYERFFAGDPDLSRYEPRLSTAAWEGAPGLSSRSARLGPLRTFDLVREIPVDGERSFFFRAIHERGVVYVRLSIDAESRISRLVWWHI